MIIRVRFFLCALLMTIGLSTVLATPAAAQSVVQSYGVVGSLQTGMIVELAGAGDVEALSQTSANKMFGVVINPTDTTVTLSSNNAADQTFVATTGTYDVLVSNQDGVINVGDYVTISSITGIGMRAGSSDQIVLGKATQAFTGTSDSVGSDTIKQSNGHSTTIQLGRIAVNITVIRNPLLQPSQSDVPSFLQRAGQSLTNKPVSSGRVYIGLAVLIVTMIIAGSLLYGGVRSSITAIGRNPLSRKSVIRSLIQVTFTSLIVFIIGLFAVYLLLRF